MRDNPVISVVHLRHSFPTRERRLRGLLGPLKRRGSEVTALDDVSLTVDAGYTLGILGDDGAGKTTLLRVIAGALVPASGEVTTSGRVCSVIGTRTLHTGSPTPLSYIQRTASKLGVSKKLIRQKLPEIAAFAGVSDLRRPLGSHLSPWWIRIAFSLAVAFEPSIVLVDDCLALTDPLFQRTCHDRLASMKSKGTSTVVVTRDVNALRTLCERVILLHKGRIVADGSASDVVNVYEQNLNERSGGLIHAPVALYTRDYRRRGQGPAKIKDIRIEDSDGTPVTRLLTGSRYRFHLTISTQKHLEDLTARIALHDQFGNQVFGTSTRNHGLAFGALRAGQSAEIVFEVPVLLAPGDYFIGAALHPGAIENSDLYDRIDNALHFEILARGPERSGAVWLPTRARINLE